jgi:hypothetical protein
MFAKTREKSVFFSSFLFTDGFSIRYHLVANAPLRAMARVESLADSMYTEREDG